jgi:hypothetical protein
MTDGAPQRLNRGHLRRRPHGTPTEHSIGAETLSVRKRYRCGNAIGAETLNGYSIR